MSYEYYTSGNDNQPSLRRYQDKSSAKHNLDDFLKGAYAKQMKELNGTTGRMISKCIDELS